MMEVPLLLARSASSSPPPSRMVNSAWIRLTDSSAIGTSQSLSRPMVNLVVPLLITGPASDIRALLGSPQHCIPGPRWQSKAIRLHRQQRRHQLDAVPQIDRKSTRLNYSHLGISYAVF